MKVGVLGLWHLGTVISACLAAAGHDVVGVDDYAQVVADLNEGMPPLSEPELPEMVRRGIDRGKLRFAGDLKRLSDRDVLWVAIDTPVDEFDRADIHYVKSRVEKALPWMAPDACIIISSQVPVGFTAMIAELCSSQYPEKNFSLAYCPENLRLGKAVSCFTRPDRVVVGTACDAARAFVRELMKTFTDNFIFMSVESAEMTKHALNAFLALSITFANEIASLCELVGADGKEVESGLKSEKRIGPLAYLSPGGAFSGGTLARDVAFLVDKGKQVDCPTRLLSAIRESNEEHKQWVLRRLKHKLNSFRGQVIAVLGLTYKPGTSTLRRSSSIELCRWLADQGSIVRAHDPAISQLPVELARAIELKSSAKDAMQGAQAVIVATEWPEFRQISAEQLLECMREPFVIDANGFLRSHLENESKITYAAVGKP